jgi:hypothetical protein
MSKNIPHPQPHWLAILALALALDALGSGRALGQFRTDGPDFFRQPPILPRSLFLLDPSDQSPLSPLLKQDPSRVRLPGMQPGFLWGPPGLDSDDELAADPMQSSVTTPNNVNIPLQVNLGADNPYFDLRRPGDPGGVGYYRLHTQYQLYEDQRTGCSIAMQAVTPAGLDNDGVANGRTTISPAFGLFHTLDDGTVIQGFVGKHVHAGTGWTENFGSHIRYGAAVQRPLTDLAGDSVQGCYLFLEALGRYRYQVSENDWAGRPLTWEVLPGVHWRLSDSMWLSGAYVLPIKTLHSDSGLWQITCSWQF